ncbi:MAG: AAA family ATPase [Actinobacteria bacterium]|nr:AAA family ATPase [Actinomycetota bacterium]
MVERLLVGLLARGHCLLEGVPGVAKTLAVETLAHTVSGSFSRLQFTPDLVPSDIVGTRIYRAGSERFDTELGPIMANFVLADEINRAPAKVQSALLEVMAERHVTIGGQRFDVPSPFLVLATQNPIESEGVYQLPEAQRDRFLMKIDVGYPSAAEEREIVYRMGTEPPVAQPVISTAELARIQATAARVFVHHAIVDYVVRLVLATREPASHGLPDVAGWVAYGASPRASLGLIAAARALALLRGRDYVLPQDVLDVAVDVLPHRLVLSYDAVADGVPPVEAVRRILQAVPLPQVAPRQRATAGYPPAPAGYPQPGYGAHAALPSPPGFPAGPNPGGYPQQPPAPHPAARQPTNPQQQSLGQAPPTAQPLAGQQPSDRPGPVPNDQRPWEPGR